MKKIYIVKKLYVADKKYDSLDIKAFAKEEAALGYVETEIKECKEESSKYKGFHTWEEGFNSSIYNHYETDDIHFDVETISIDNKVQIPDEIYVYTEVNTYDSGEICAHAIGCLTKEDAKKEFTSEIKYRADEDCENHYWISDGDIEDEWVELVDENSNISYLQYGIVDVQK